MGTGRRIETVYFGFQADTDVAEWIKESAKAERLTFTAFLNRILAAQMEAESGRRKRRSPVEVG